MVPAVTATYGSSTPFVLGSVTLSPVLLSFSIQKKKKKRSLLTIMVKNVRSATKRGFPILTKRLQRDVCVPPALDGRGLSSANPGDDVAALSTPSRAAGSWGDPRALTPDRLRAPRPQPRIACPPGRAPCRPVLPAHCGQTSRPGHLPARFIRPAAQLCLSAVNKYTFSQCSAMKYSPGLS